MTRPRVRIGTLMLVVAALGGMFGWSAAASRRAAVQSRAVRSIRDSYPSRRCFPGSTALYRHPDVAPPGHAESFRRWLGSRFGRDYFQDVVYLELNGRPPGGRPCSDDPLARIEALTGLETLRWGAAGATDADLVHLPALTRLTELMIWSPRVTDAGLAHLAGLLSLRRLHLNRCNVTDAGLDYLATLTRLESLELFSTRVTPAGVARLRHALPMLKVTVNAYHVAR